MLWSQNLSLLSPQALSERENRGLLVQFLMFELIEACKSVESDNLNTLITAFARFFPYDWSLPTGHLNKLLEHSLLLKQNFPDNLDAVMRVEQLLPKMLEELSSTKSIVKEQFRISLQEILSSLLPFIEICKENENLIFFLLKNRQVIDTLTYPGYFTAFLLKIHPCGLETLGEKMCDKYHQRGFISQIQEFKLLLIELIHA